jgi:hypothetical protein
MPTTVWGSAIRRLMLAKGYRSQAALIAAASTSP